VLFRKIKEILKEKRGGELMPGLIWEEYPLSAKTFLNLSEEGGDVGVFNFYNPDDRLPMLAGINIPTIAVMGKKDTAGTIPVEDIMKRMKGALTSSPKAETVVLGNADHGYTDHEQKLADTILGWINNI